MSGLNRNADETARRQARLVLALLLAVASITTAAAEVMPRGERAANDIKYGDWTKLCFKPGGAKAVCRTSITGTYQTGQTAVRVDLIEREGDQAVRLQLFVPVGMYLQVPVKLTVDQIKTYSVPYSWCLTNACIAAEAGSPQLIKDMEKGKTLALQVVDPNLLSVTTLVPLAQFAAVHNGAPAQTLEQDIDE